MKKLAISAILGASLVISSSAFALTSMTDSGMKAATGQAGVSIALDNVVIETYTGETAYTDSDGLGGTAGTMAGAAASVVISDKHVVKTYLAMTSAADYQEDFGTAMGWTLNAAGDEWTKGTLTSAGLDSLVEGTWDEAKALSIDVGLCAALSAGYSDNHATTINIAGVVIGLPTLLIHTTGDTYSVGIRMTDGTLAGSAANTGKNYITVSKSDSVMAILGGTVEIAPH